MRKPNAWDAWDIAHGQTPTGLPHSVAEALRLGGQVAHTTKPQSERGTNPNSNGGNHARQHHAPTTPPPPDDPPPIVHSHGEPPPEDPNQPPITEDNLATLRQLAALGDMQGFRRHAERLAVNLAIRIITADGGATPLTSLVADIAYALDISTQTAKRYIHKHASRWGELILDGDIVLLRRKRGT